MDPFIKKIHSRPINGTYLLAKKLGAGGFGVVYQGTFGLRLVLQLETLTIAARDTRSGQNVALKMEYYLVKPSLLYDGAERYKAFEGEVGFLEIYWYGQHDYYQVLAFELLGPSLEDLFAYCERRFSLKTTLLILEQLLLRLEVLHSKDVVHRDIKPRNFLLGSGSKGNERFLTDFGLVEEHEVRPNHVEVDAEPQSRLVGTARFASIRGHQDLRGLALRSCLVLV
nr:casein kinase i isoform delta [Quercus suber]